MRDQGTEAALQAQFFHLPVVRFLQTSPEHSAESLSLPPPHPHEPRKGPKAEKRNTDDGSGKQRRGLIQIERKLAREMAPNVSQHSLQAPTIVVEQNEVVHVPEVTPGAQLLEHEMVEAA